MRHCGRLWNGTKPTRRISCVTCTLLANMHMTDTNYYAADAYATLRPIMERYGATGSPCAFQEAVNLTFHEFESAVYDQIHREMWETLPAHFDYLSRALISVLPHDRHLRVLDVGCGTGLSSELLLQTDLSRLICHIDLLDTSEPMLAKVRDRAQKWGVPHATILGTIDAIPPSSQYDLIMACSVLHHIPDLKNRLRPAVRESYLELVNTSFIARTVIRKEGSSGESVGEFRGSARRLSEESVELAAGGVKGTLVVFPAVVD